MNRIEKTLLMLGFVGLSYSVQALTAENRYDTITDRNIFRLNPKPVPTASTNNEAVLDRKIDLSGISNVGGQKKAWFVASPKAGSKDLPLYLNLGEGQRQDFLEVVSINDVEGEVKILNAGNSMVLSLKNNSLKAQPVAPAVTPPPSPAAKPVATLPAPPPATALYGNNTSPSYGNASYKNNSYNNGGVTVSGGTPFVPAANSHPAETSGLRSIPTRTLRLAPVPSQQQTATPPVNPDEQAALMLIQKKVAESQGQNFPPLPFSVPE